LAACHVIYCRSREGTYNTSTYMYNQNKIPPFKSSHQLVLHDLSSSMYLWQHNRKSLNLQHSSFLEPPFLCFHLFGSLSWLQMSLQLLQLPVMFHIKSQNDKLENKNNSYMEDKCLRDLLLVLPFLPQHQF